MRDFDASWASHDGRKHVRFTHVMRVMIHETIWISLIQRNGLEYGILKRYVLEKPPAAPVDTTLKLTNKTQQIIWTGKYPL